MQWRKKRWIILCIVLVIFSCLIGSRYFRTSWEIEGDGYVIELPKKWAELVYKEKDTGAFGDGVYYYVFRLEEGTDFLADFTKEKPSRLTEHLEFGQKCMEEPEKKEIPPEYALKDLEEKGSLYKKIESEKNPSSRTYMIYEEESRLLYALSLIF